MKHVAPKSPLALSNNIEKKGSFSTEKICRNYLELGIDVKRFFNDNSISLYECKDSGYRFYYPFETVGDAEFYKDLSESRVNYYSERWEHKRALNFIKKNDHVLEIGSGFGIFLKMLESRGVKSKGLELNPVAVEKCIEASLDVEQKLIQDLAERNKNKFDVVCFFQVLEHITEVYDFIKSAIETLKPGGKLIIGVPNNNPYLHISDKYHSLNLPPHHAGLWSKKSLKSLTDIFPLKMVNMEFEPLSNSYGYFIDFHIKNNKCFIVRLLLKIANKLNKNLTKEILNKIFNGRNIFVVFEKTH